MRLLLPLASILLVQALAPFASANAAPGNDLKALCGNKDVDLTTLSQLKELAAGAAAESSCSANVRAALEEMVPVIERGKGDLCSANSVAEIRAYYSKFLDNSVEKKKEKLPKSLERFFLAYGLQMSNLCKKNMVRVITDESHKLLNDKDFEPFKELITDDGPVAQVLGAMASSPDEVFLPGDLAPFLLKNKNNNNNNAVAKDGDSQVELSSDKLIMQTATGPFVKNLQAVCQRRFKPIYGPLMMPLVQLSNVGFNYKDEPLICDLKCPKVVHELSQWSRIVFLCEAIGGVEIVQIERDQDLALGAQRSQLRILTKEEADTLKAEHTTASATVDDSEYEQIVYNQDTNPVTMDDAVYDKTDKKLSKVIDQFKTNRKEEDIIKKKMTDRGMDIIKSQLAKGRIGLIISAAFKGLMRNFGKKDQINPTQMMVKNLDEIVEAQRKSNNNNNKGSQDGNVVGTALNARGAQGMVILELTMVVISVALACLLFWGMVGIVGIFGR